MAEFVYIMCAVMSIVCAVLLARGFLKSRARLLMWSCFCFVGLAVNSGFLAIDMLLFGSLDLYGPLVRSALAAFSGSLLLFGLIEDLT